MPKVVDHDARRLEIAESALGLLADDGTAGASVRAVAAASGWTPGVVGYYFTDRQGLLRFVADHLGRAIPARIQSVLRSDLESAPLARTLVHELMPLDQRRVVEAKAWLALASATSDPVIAETIDRGWIGERRLCRIAVALVRTGQPPLDPDQPLVAGELQAQLVHAALDGLVLQAVTTPQRSRIKEQVDLIDQALGIGPIDA